MYKFIIISLIFVKAFSFDIQGRVVNSGYYIDNVLLNNRKEIEIAMNLWKNEVSIYNDLEINAKFYHKRKSILKDFFEKKKINVILVDPLTYLDNKEKFLSVTSKMWIFQKYGKAFKKYYLLKNTASKKTLDNSLIIFKKRDSFGKVWLDYLFLKKYKKSFETFNEDNFVKKQSTAILKLFFNKADYAVVSKEAWDIMSELNPAIKKKIKIVNKSKSIFPSNIGFIDNRLNKDTSKKFINSLIKLNSSIRGQEILEIIKYDGISFVKNDFFKDLEKFYEKYKEIKKEYEK